MSIITGTLFLHSETGTEGGSWAIQNDEFITPPPPAEPFIKICATCNRYWNTLDKIEEPKPSFTYYRAEHEENGKTYMGGYYSSEEPVEGGQTTWADEEEGSDNDKWTRAGNDASLKCFEHGHTWEWQKPHESWSYEGLIVLRNGDELEVFDPQDEDKVIDVIAVKLIEQEDQYAMDAKDARGMVIHTYPDPETIDFETWNNYFFSQHRARLTRDV